MCHCVGAAAIALSNSAARSRVIVVTSCRRLSVRSISIGG
jgi:hypothetical protein